MLTLVLQNPKTVILIVLIGAIIAMAHIGGKQLAARRQEPIRS